jgi:hypothetical protein
MNLKMEETSMKKMLSPGSAALLMVLLAAFFTAGCGGGGASGANNPPEPDGGKSTQAAITRSNAKTLIDAGSYSAPLTAVAGGSQQEAPSLRSGPAQGAHTAAYAPDTLSGNCGGTAVSDSSYDSATAKIAGTTTYTDYCRDGTTMNGQTTFSGAFTQSSSYLDVTFTFTDYSEKNAASHIVTNGTAALKGSIEDGNITNGDMTMSASVEDAIAGATVKMEDVISSITATTTHTDMTILSGRLYHPDFGYADLATTSPIRTQTGEQHPSSGVLVMTGANNTKAKVTYISNTQYKVEVDESGGGTYALLGTYDWTTLSASGTAPTISAVSPPSGAAGATVTITGANFGATTASNTVKFNGTEALVASATATQIVTTVPAGAATGAISVTTAGITASSSAAFTVTTDDNAALVGLWRLSTLNGQPLEEHLTLAAILNPDNTYIAALINNSTGEYCTELGAYSSDGTALTETITASTCDPESVNAVSTSAYQLSENTLTITNADGEVLVWEKESTTATSTPTPPSLVGKWGDMTISGTQYYNTATGWSSTNGGGVQIEFKADGSFTEATYIKSTLYGCTWTAYAWTTGTYTVNGGELTFTDTEHYKKIVDTCSASKNFDGQAPLETKTYPWSIQQVAAEGAGESWYTGPAAFTTLILDRYASGSSQYRRQE